MKAYVDGEVVAAADARVPLLHRGYLLGEGVFETMRSRNGRVFRYEDHQKRMARGLRLLNIEPEILDEVNSAVDAMLDLSEQYIRINVHAGDMEDIAGIDVGVHVTGICKPFKPYSTRLRNGITLATSSFKKQPGALSNVKSLSYLPFVLARREAVLAGAHDALLLNAASTVAEASTSNVFAVIEGELFAPGATSGALEGVTRNAVLELANDAGFTVHEELHPHQLETAEEVFLTNTTGGVIPAIALDGLAIGGGERGETTARFSRALEASRDL